jgi:myo-inositol 2-dehydrogenase / D-chiro-inositol 1-dehydrogenase
VAVKGKGDGFTAKMTNLYAEGAINNIVTFADSIRKGDFSNPTVTQSVRSNLTTILGRTAAYNMGREVTWKDIMSKREKFEFNTKGLKA